MQNRYFIISSVVALLFAGAVVGYAIPVEKQEVPARVILDNTGGRVVFAHRVHAEDYGSACDDCHHDGLEGEAYLPCGTCHPAEFDETFRAEHQKAFPDRKACLRCHDEVPTGPLAEDARPDIESIPTRGEAFHTLCMGCHEENGGPFGDDACYQCHAR
ncbi:cytochrome c3 family protein [Pseudodesulfovibrio methanolicus]|uniref:Cytochrome c3 family protein n=1 Tax=Pseudodesulfovibrio methanolicus TaxID=3126690 RepID=A0ABZ2IQ24_9BACT